jgi:hypothetical protein
MQGNNSNYQQIRLVVPTGEGEGKNLRGAPVIAQVYFFRKYW